MRAFKSLCIAAIACFSAFAAPTASAHPYNVWAEEEFMSFRYAGGTYKVVNTHRRGFLGGELIEIRDHRGRTSASWWTNRGWCFTAHSLENHPCWHPAGYTRLFIRRLQGEKANVLARNFGGYSAPSSTDFCDHYTQLEYTVSGDTSGKCGHQDGLPLPSWAQ
jgi:hypothetical protein